MVRPRAIVYIDGFNLYRRCLERHPELKWLDLLAFAQNLLPYCEIATVHYFTARLRPGTSLDHQKPQRQQAYLRALETFAPRVQIHLGQFRVDRRDMMAHPVELDPVTGDYRRVGVKKIEEKGSDVNLAVRMVSDAHLGLADFYVMLTNDSDQAGTLRVVSGDAGGITGLVLPMETARASKELMKAKPDFVGFVTRPILAASQLPETIRDAVGTIRRPAVWGRTFREPRDQDHGAL